MKQSEFSFIETFWKILDEHPPLNPRFKALCHNDCLYYDLENDKEWPLDPWNQPWADDPFMESHHFGRGGSWIQHAKKNGILIRCCISSIKWD